MNAYELFWAGVIVYCIVMYVILDGFTLGTGILLPFLNDQDSDIAMSVILPTWDGNQTWLVLGFACLYGAYPLAFALLMPALYLPLLIMGIFLLFRGVAFEFRLKSAENKHRWSYVFAIAALSCAFIQGLILGAFVQGFTLNADNTQITSTHIGNGFSIFTAISLVLGYLLLGTTRLILKTENHLREQMYRLAPWLALLVGICAVAVSIWTPFINPTIANRWLDSTLWAYLSPMPVIMAIAFLILVIAIIKRKDHIPYWTAVIMFLCPYAGFIASLYPYIVPFHVYYWDAASGIAALRFTLVGACIMIPVLTIYTYYSYSVFKGKVKDVLSY